MVEVRRDDGELLGHVTGTEGRWQARTVFGAVLGEHAGADEAQREVRERGLAVLADRWTLVDGETGEEQVVVIQHVSPSEVVLALGPYSMPEVPTLTLTVHELADRWRLEHRS